MQVKRIIPFCNVYVTAEFPMVHEVVLLPEMLEAGMEAWDESAGQTTEQRVVAVFLAMRAIEEICALRKASDTLH